MNNLVVGVDQQVLALVDKCVIGVVGCSGV